MKKFIVFLLLGFVFSFAQATPLQDFDVGNETAIVKQKTDKVISPVYNADTVIVKNVIESIKIGDTLINDKGDKFIVISFFEKSDTIINYDIDRIRCYKQNSIYFIKELKQVKSKSNMFIGTSGGLPLMQ